MNGIQSVARCFPKSGSAICAILVTMGISTPANAQWLNASGRITINTVSGGNNFAFRIWLQQDGVDPLSNCNHNFAYINADDSNYQAKVALLLTASWQGKPVQIYYNRDTTGWCAIADVAVVY